MTWRRITIVSVCAPIWSQSNSEHFEDNPYDIQNRKSEQQVLNHRLPQNSFFRRSVLLGGIAAKSVTQGPVEVAAHQAPSGQKSAIFRLAELHRNTLLRGGRTMRMCSTKVTSAFHRLHSTGQLAPFWAHGRQTGWPYLGFDGVGFFWGSSSGTKFEQPQ